MSVRRLARLLIVLLPLVWLAVTPSARQAQRPTGAPASADPFASKVRPFLDENCIFCHNGKLQSGGLDLDAFKTSASLNEHRETWERAIEKMRSGEMPPKGAPRPPEAEVKAVIAWLEGEFARADRLVKPDPGRVTARRLNRAEYNNTVRDLLGVDLRPADDFPQDDSGYGFDNIGDVLSLSPVLMEKYLTAAERVARTAVFGPTRLKPTLVRLPSPGRRIIARTKPLFEYDESGLSLPNALHVEHRFPVDGEYLLRVFFGGVRPLSSESLQVALWIDGRQIEVREFDPEKFASFGIDRQDLGGMTQEFRVPLKAGDHWIAVSFLRLYEGLPPKYEGPNPSRRPAPPKREFRPPPNLPPERVAEFRKRFEAQQAEIVPVNDFRASTLEVGGPYNQVTGPSIESLKRIYVCGHFDGRHAAGCGRRIVTNLARRAYRRPVATAEVNQLLGLLGQAQEEGDTFEEGLCQAIQAMLVSPHFLFRIEDDRATSGRQLRAGSAQPLGDFELASRLSYFLWSSMPDDVLLDLAERRLLRRPAVMAAQVRRMLKDPKSRALVENFGGQWLELRRLESVKPDRQRFPEFEEYLRMSMERETELFFEEIVRSDRSILEFIDADYTFLNERLALFYKIPGVKGPEFRKVMLNGRSRERGGVLTQASVLTVTSYANRTSPVLRGKWILDNFLNAPPPPAPPGVPNLDETAVGTTASLRQQMEAHRKNPTCASCHARMDPLGFGLENFDAIGGWRTEDGKFPIDASGSLPDGRSFKGPGELKAILLADREAFAEGISEKLLTYALGRGLERYDRPVVKKIARRVAENDYRFSSLVLEIVNSMPFQMRRGDRAL